jgi:cellulose synthase/poly-beta-1,6-N-acetylglucosamine synthase-like glycosyltransferase
VSASANKTESLFPRKFAAIASKPTTIGQEKKKNRSIFKGSFPGEFGVSRLQKAVIAALWVHLWYRFPHPRRIVAIGVAPDAKRGYAAVALPQFPEIVMVAATASLMLLVFATAASLAYFLPTLASLLPRRRRTHVVPSHTFAILIPAHNEEATLPATLQSLAVLDYPPELVRVYVVADNCTDDTVVVAWETGAVCVVRTEPNKRGKGYAVAFGLRRVLKDSPDVVLILDADCRLNADALRALDERFAVGAKVVQCAVRSANADDGSGGYVAAIGAAVDEAVAVGRDRFGVSVQLRGTGMALRREVLKRVPWAAFGVAEDAEYARKLRSAGLRVKHCGGAVVHCDAPRRVGDLCRQRRRWSAAGVLASKPLALGLLSFTVATAFAFGFVWWPSALVLVTGTIYLRAAWAVGVSWHRFGLMLKSPPVVLRLGWVALAGSIDAKQRTWERTPRPVEGEIALERRAA